MWNKLGIMANFMFWCTGQILSHYSGCVCENVSGETDIWICRWSKAEGLSNLVGSVQWIGVLGRTKGQIINWKEKEFHLSVSKPGK